MVLLRTGCQSGDLFLHTFAKITCANRKIAWASCAAEQGGLLSFFEDSLSIAIYLEASIHDSYHVCLSVTAASEALFTKKSFAGIAKSTRNKYTAEVR